MSRAATRPRGGRTSAPAAILATDVRRLRIVDRWLTSIDPVAAVRGMSSGFSVLVVGGLAAPILSRTPAIGSLALVLTSVAGFIVAARCLGNSRVAWIQGMTAALGAYLLVLPLVGMTTRSWNLTQILATALTAVVVGACAGHLIGRFGNVGARP